ncbi:toprim domain-containing protein [Paenibacillus agilis]|uniref:Toprim domain-containing protein n=1 Tax=Paenibacillus agilis TaxID=3020863 RepID=A0A559ID59_9BACL|nr:toprim domain-containing protein [Paenibacillus agilis]TVX85607.1 toprim domain-containing protein [Paenibacillus agilis]
MNIRFEQTFVNNLLGQVEMIDVMANYGVEVKRGQGLNHFYVAKFCCGKSDMDNGRIKIETQKFMCMNCWYGGNAIDFLRTVVGMSFYTAVVELARMANVELPVVDPKELESLKRKQDAFQLAATFYAEYENDYLVTRGIAKEVIEKHGVGYAPGGRALRSFLEGKGYTKEELLDYKLINSKGMDTLFHRAVIPVSRNGKIIDLYGRSINDENTSLKHLYIKGDNILGGIDQINPKHIVLLFEAAIDRLVAESHGVQNGVDAGGAGKFTKEHAKLLKRKGVKRVFIVYDGDAAGRKGSLKSGQLLSDEGMEVWVGELPEQMDPARMIMECGKDAFVSALQQPKTFEKFKMYQELSKYSLTDVEEYLKVMKLKQIFLGE